MTPNPNIVKFTELLEADASLQSQVAGIRKQATHALAGEMADLAAEAGVPFTAEDYLAGLQGIRDELPDDELEVVAGGSFRPTELIALSSSSHDMGCHTAPLSTHVGKLNKGDCLEEIVR